MYLKVAENSTKEVTFMTKLTGKPIERQQEEPKAKRVKRRQAPGRTVESRENQIIRLAYDLAEKRIRNGTATSQEVNHFLKIGSTLARLERIKLENENRLLMAKTDAIESQKRIEELYNNAIKSMSIYQGREVSDDEDY
jgi:hypothetical protein